MGALYRDLVRKHSKAKGSARALLNVLADYADDDGRAWPGRDALANDTGMSERNVTRCLQTLCNDGRLAIEENAKGGRGRVPVYKIIIPELIKGDKLSPKRETDCHPLDVERVTNERIKGDNLSIKGDKIAEIPSCARSEPQEPHIEPKGEKRPYKPIPANFGIERPQRPAQRFVNGIAAQRGELGMTPKQFTDLTNAVLDGMKKRKLADLDTRQGQQELAMAQECALALAAEGYREPQKVATLFESYRRYDWRGKKGELPTYETLVDHIAELPSLIQATKEKVNGNHSASSGTYQPPVEAGFTAAEWRAFLDDPAREPSPF